MASKNTLIDLVRAFPEVFSNDFSDRLIPNFNEKESYYWKGIINDKIHDDNGVAELFFNKRSSSEVFKNFKYRFKKKFNNLLLLYNNKKGSKLHQVYISILRDYFISKLLSNLGYKDAAVNYALTVFNNAEKYQFNEFAFDAARMLFRYYGGQRGDIEKCNFYFEKTVLIGSVINMETISDYRYVELMSYFTRKKELNEEVSARARAYMNKYEKFLTKINSHRFHIQTYRIGIIEKESIGDIPGALEIAKDALEYFENFHFRHNGALQIFTRMVVHYYLHLNNLEEATPLLMKIIEEQHEKNHIWFRNQSLLLLILLRCEKYQEGLKLYKAVVKELRFAHESFEIRERWKLHGLYLDILGYLGVIHSSCTNRINKSIEELKNFRADKTGMNLPLMICETIYAYEEGNEYLLELRINALRAFSGKYLKGTENERSKIFIKLLSLTAFDKSIIRQKAKPLLEQLYEKPTHVARQAKEVEIIPYENLWGLIIGEKSRMREAMATF